MPAHGHLMKCRTYGTAQQMYASSVYEAGGPKAQSPREGLTRQMIALKSNPDGPAHLIKLIDVLKAIDGGARDVVYQVCARAGGAFVPFETGTATMRDIAMKSPLECGEFLSTLADVISTGKPMTREQGAALQKEIIDVMRLLSAAYCSVRDQTVGEPDA